jgi:hypothetical protein
MTKKQFPEKRKVGGKCGRNKNGKVGEKKLIEKVKKVSERRSLAPIKMQQHANLYSEKRFRNN